MSSDGRRSPISFLRQRGSALVGVMIVLIVLSVALSGILSFSSNTHRNSVRQSRVEEARLIAESEMEYLFYRWKSEIYSGTPSTTVASELVTDGFCATDINTGMTPFSETIATNGWTVVRMLRYDPVGTGDGSATGLKPGTSKTGKNYYFSAYVRAYKNDPNFGLIEYRAGRRFVRSETSLFQFSVFYQSDLEIATGSNMTIRGPISANGSAFIGSQVGRTLTITDKLRVFQQFNGADDVLSGTTMRKTGVGGSATTLIAPVFDTNLFDGTTPNQTAARSAQVEKLSAPENFVGGIDVGTVVASYPDAYRNLSGVTDSNEVYRSVIAPPPKNGLGIAIAEDPIVASRRMYNRAGIVITVTEVLGVTTVRVGTPSNPALYTVAAGSALDTIVPPSERRKAVFDKRENANLAVTSIDVAQLKAALESTPTLRNAYNGVVYVHDTTDSGAGSAIRLKNAETTPAYNDSNGQPMGFSVVSNNGLYVQGDYNTTQITDGGELRNNPAALMGDAVTVLSEGWDDALSTSTIYNRTASADVTIKAAVLTGNTPSSAGANSGGVQNLVRHLENWQGRTVTIQGSLGQLFVSKFMNSDFRGSNEIFHGDYTYWVPSNRVLEFDYDLASRPPARTPTTTDFFRGDFFNW